MFGQNEIVGRKYFKDAPEKSLKVVSRFFTLQGEGPWRGYPAYFIRLSKCNLACNFCDTYFDDGDYITYDQIFEQMNIDIEKFYTDRNEERPSWTQEGLDNKMLIVITGGEPTLQTNLTEFLEQCHKRGYVSQIESNGLLYLDVPYRTTYVVSPKCLEKDGKVVRYLQPNPKVLERASCLKFVISADKDSPYSEVPEWAHEWAIHYDGEVYVSPMNIYNDEPQQAKELRQKTNQITIEERSTVDETISFWEPGLLNMEENKRNHEYAAEYAMKHGFILNLQIHLYASLP